MIGGMGKTYRFEAGGTRHAQRSEADAAAHIERVVIHIVKPFRLFDATLDVVTAVSGAPCGGVPDRTSAGAAHHKWPASGRQGPLTGAVRAHRHGPHRPSKDEMSGRRSEQGSLAVHLAALRDRRRFG